MLFVLNVFFSYFCCFFLGIYFHILNLSLISTHNFFSSNSCIYRFIFLFDWLRLIFYQLSL